jgi:hypothetical protein
MHGEYQNTLQVAARIPPRLAELGFEARNIGAGMTATFDYTFSMPMMQQALAFGCYTANASSVIEMPMRLSP